MARMSVTQIAESTLTLVIRSPLVVKTTTLPEGDQNQPYSATLSASGGSLSYRWTATGLPAGLTCAPDGTISGTPTVASAVGADGKLVPFTFRVSVSDAG